MVHRIFFDIIFLSVSKHVERNYEFKLETVKNHSKQDFGFKFWTYIFEEYFGAEKLSIHW